uniref:Ribonuclease H-like domain-containing protein n=1 Tax=Tanacetum cinerariifolium TaxID=118510 RepID=A0A6L2M2K6_TANCI|nr:ribonuclease H-like domain-containing protein [Tanacetum cinerariifolium]
MKKLLNMINNNEAGNFHANMHLTVPNVGMINVVDVTSLSIIVDHPNGTLATISHIGNLKLSDNVILYDVLVILGLGHPANQVLATLHNNLKISKSSSVPVCEVCHRAKQTREPFSLSIYKSKNHGDLVHLDLWCPYRVTSREGPQSPNDEGRTSSVKDGNSPLSRHRTIDNPSLYQEEVSATHFGDQILSEGIYENNDDSIPTQTENVFGQDSGVQV